MVPNSYFAFILDAISTNHGSRSSPIFSELSDRRLKSKKSGKSKKSKKYVSESSSDKESSDVKCFCVYTCSRL